MHCVGYNASLDPSIDNFFATVAYRYGHSTINDVVLRLDETWSEHPKGHLTLPATYYNLNVALEGGLEPLLRGLIVQSQAKIEPRWSQSVAGNFAGAASANGTSGAIVRLYACGRTNNIVALSPRHVPFMCECMHCPCAGSAWGVRVQRRC